MEHTPRKRFGQNFLNDAGVIANIIQAIHPKFDDNMVEIGPGLGALTNPLLNQLKQLTIIEIDHDLQQYWLTHSLAPRLNLIAKDALTVDYSLYGDHVRIIGNLPYNISTPLLFHLLTYRTCIKDMIFMLQKEVVDRMVAAPGSKTYGRLSVMLQYHCETTHLFDVPSTAFSPKPKVESAMVHLIPRPSPAPVNVGVLEKCVTSSFAMRRKTLANNLKSIINPKYIAQLGIDPGIRPEQVSVDDFVRIARRICELSNENSLMPASMDTHVGCHDAVTLSV